MATFTTLYSGSSGNASLISDNGTSVLVDIGRSCRFTVAALEHAGQLPSTIRALLLTHEHADHVAGLHTFLRKFPVPVFAAGPTLEYLRLNKLVPEGARLIDIDGLSGFEIDNISFVRFNTSHDSAACVGYRMQFSNGASAAIATDLGIVTEDVQRALCGCSLVALESNYDKIMLEFGSYPYILKRRIRSETGHLSNDDCAEVAIQIAKQGTSHLVLMHLSQENNAPELALTTCLSRLEDNGLSMRVSVAPRHSVAEPIEV